MRKLGCITLALVAILALFGALAGPAGATPTTVADIVFTFPFNSGTISVSNNTGNTDYPYLFTATESGSGWTVFGTDAGLDQITPTYTIASGTIKITGADPTNAVFHGWIGATEFTFSAAITAQTEDYSHTGTSSNFSWEANPANIGQLANFFNPSGPYTDAVGFTFKTDSGKITGGSGSFQAVPAPPALLLFAPALLGLFGIRKRLKAGKKG